VSDWTDANVHDPGITVVQALVWGVGGLFAAALVWRFRRRRDP
jgi:hypothetical protein